jgi:hypothetical protein
MDHGMKIRNVGTEFTEFKLNVQEQIVTLDFLSIRTLRQGFYYRRWAP